MKKVLGIMGLMGAMALSVMAQATTAQLGFGTGSTNLLGTTSYAVVSANSANGGAPVVTFINGSSDLSTSLLTFYRVDAITVVTHTNATVTIPVIGTNNIADAGRVIIRHVLNDTYEVRTLTTSTGATNIVATVAPLGTCVPGDLIYHVTSVAAGKINWGASTNSIASGGPIYTGQAGYPLFMEINGTTVSSINSVGGYYQSTAR